MPFLLTFALAGCGEPVRDDHFANRAEAPPVEAAPQVEHVVAVRVGELGPNFDACSAAGTTRHLKAGDSLPVRAAPFGSAAETGRIAPASRFFICTRSHDQKWFGVVYDEGGALAESCGVSSPVTARREYPGPCRSGWVASAFVRLVAGVDQAPPRQGETSPGAAGTGKSG
jgi:hypothetical protein